MARKRTGVSGPYKHGKRWRVVSQKAGAREVFSFETEVEAQAFIDEWRSLAEGESVTAALDRWIDVLKAKDAPKSSLQARRDQIKRLLPHLPDKIETVTPTHAQRAYSAIVAEGYRPDTHRISLSAAREMWRALYGRTKPTPWDGVRPVGKRTKGKPQLTIDESRRLLAAALELAEYKPRAISAALCLCLAMRIGEVAGLKSRDVDDGGRILWVQKGKNTNARRLLEVPDVIRPHLVKLAARGGRLFPVTRQALAYWVEEVRKAANVSKVSPHGLRGTHATIARSAGATSHVVAAALGHASPSTTREHYFAPGTEERADAARWERQMGTGYINPEIAPASRRN